MSNNLSVPYRQQLADGYCLPACVQIVLAYWHTEQSQEKLARKLKTVAGAGTPRFHLQWLASSGLEVVYRSGDLTDLQLALQRGIPPIVLVHTSQLPYWKEATAHAVVVAGMDGFSVFIHDPVFAQPALAVSVGDFLLAWDELLYRYGLLRKR
jgi:ABC-type bacteriocin/lantibiotic exporter with double-glycine peptidase domain